MKENLILEDKNRPSTEFKNSLEEVLREGARKLLEQAIENEIQDYIEQFKGLKTEENRRVVTRNGYLPERFIQTDIGEVLVKQLRVRDKRKDQKFSSQILPPYLRRTSSLDALIPALYLKGISTGDFGQL